MIPTAIHLGAALALSRISCCPRSRSSSRRSSRKAADVGETVKTGRTHLMDAMPVTLGQEMGAWRTPDRRRRDAPAELPAAPARAGTGRHGRRHGHQCPSAVRAPGWRRCCRRQTGLDLRPARDFFAALASQDTAVELSGQLRTLAVSADEDRERPALDEQRPARRARRNRAARAAAGQQHHAGQGQSRRSGSGRDGGGAGDGQRRDHCASPASRATSSST